MHTGRVNNQADRQRQGVDRPREAERTSSKEPSQSGSYSNPISRRTLPAKAPLQQGKWVSSGGFTPGSSRDLDPDWHLALAGTKDQGSLKSLIQAARPSLPELTVGSSPYSH